MEKFEQEGKKYWEGFGKSIELAPRQYFDFVNVEKYEEFLKKYNLQNKQIIDLGSGYPSPKKESTEKKLSPLASELQETLEKRGAKIVALDIAEEPLEYQRKRGRESILGNIFQLSFKDESINGGAIILNLFNSSFKGERGEEVFMSEEECKKILEETYRVLQKDKFVIINNYGYIIAKMDNLIKFMGPEENKIITSAIIRELAGKVGFRKINDIPLDEERIKLAKKFILGSFPEALRERITINIEGSGALFIEK